MNYLASISRLRIYLKRKRTRLAKIQKELQKYLEISKIFVKKDWFSKVDKQITLWENNIEASLKERSITVPEYELFRYLEEDALLTRFISCFTAIETKVMTDRAKYRQWKGSKNQLFSSQVSQIYSTVFELLVLGKLISSSKNVELYYKNI